MSSRSWQFTRGGLVWLAVPAFSASGLFISGTLAYAHAVDRVVPCGASSGCAEVANSPASSILGVPIAFFGVAFYSLVLLLGLHQLGTANHRIVQAGITIFTALGVTASAMLLAYSHWVVQALCTWCVASGVVTVGLLATSLATRSRVNPGWPLGAVSLVGLVFIAAPTAGAIRVSQAFAPPSLDIVLSRIPFGELVPTDAPSFGPRSAPVTIFEFADLNCPACREMHSRIGRLASKNVDRIRVVFRHLPLEDLAGHETSLEAAVLVAAIQREVGKGWEFVDAVFRSGLPVTESGLADAYRRLCPSGMPNARNRNDARRDVDADMAFAQRYGIEVTPSYFIVLDGKAVAVANSLTLQSTLEGPAVQARISGQAPP